nr:IS200/IS605 family accessory protein TnpB-related protein [Scytonema sp. UIC 10036]
MILAEKSQLDCNKELQLLFKINKRYSNSIYTEVQGIVTNVNKNRLDRIKTLEGQIKSLKSDIKKRSKQIKDFAKQENKRSSKTSKANKGFKTSKTKIKKACSVYAKQRQTTQLQDAKFGLHQKKRRLHLLQSQLSHLKSTQPKYELPDVANSFVLVGSKDESSGNQLAQFDYIEKTDSFVLSIRTPYALEERLGGDYIRIDGLNFKHGFHEIVESISERCYKVKTKDGTEKWAIGYNAITLRFYWKDDCWYIAATTDITLPEITSEYLSGYVGVDLNADSVGWAVCDAQGNLLEYGDYKLDLHSKTSNQREAILCDAATFVVSKAKQYNFPIASEQLDFWAKKKQLKEKGKNYARMLSSFAYSQWHEALDNACQKHGIYHKKVNPAYSSLVGLTKFMSMYGMNSASSAAFVIARRGRRFSERLPKNHSLLPSKSAYTDKVKHVWSHWSKVARSVKDTPRHKYFTSRFNRARKVTLNCQPTYSIGGSGLLSNPIQLELFEVGAIPTGNDTVTVAVSRSRKSRKRSQSTCTQISLDFN